MHHLREGRVQYISAVRSVKSVVCVRATGGPQKLKQSRPQETNWKSKFQNYRGKIGETKNPLLASPQLANCYRVSDDPGGPMCALTKSSANWRRMRTVSLTVRGSLGHAGQAARVEADRGDEASRLETNWNVVGLLISRTSGSLSVADCGHADRSFFLSFAWTPDHDQCSFLWP
jgi:hypothetical protein